MQYMRSLFKILGIMHRKRYLSNKYNVSKVISMLCHTYELNSIIDRFVNH
jgi:hypothetical protein